MSAILNFQVDQGSSMTYTFNLKQVNGEPFNLTDIDARLQVRRSYGATKVLINCTLANGKLVIVNAALGMLAWVIAPNDTSPLLFDAKEDESMETVYDLELQSASAKVYKPAKGTLTLNREVTR